jgi:hypothetical protein
MIPKTIIWAIGVALPLSVVGQGTFRVRFDQTSYVVTPESTLTVGIVIDPAPLSGLFSYGMKVVFDEAFARVEAASAISVPPPLDFNGVLGPGADRSIGSGFAAVKGTVDFFLSPPQNYGGSLLANISVKNLVNEAGQTYPLSIEIYRTLGPSESVFVNGAGEALDRQLTFGTALVHVVPEPSGLVLMILGLAGGRLKQRCCRFPEARSTIAENCRLSLN